MTFGNECLASTKNAATSLDDAGPICEVDTYGCGGAHSSVDCYRVPPCYQFYHSRQVETGASQDIFEMNVDIGRGIEFHSTVARADSCGVEMCAFALPCWQFRLDRCDAIGSR